MARKIHQTAIEFFVEAYLKRLNKSPNRLRGELKYIQKAITLIELKIGDPCCIDPTAHILLTTWNDNQLTNTIRPVIENLNERDNKKSLLRVQDLLRKYLIRCCTKVVTINYNTTRDAIITFESDLVKKSYVTPTLNAAGASLSYTITLPNLGKYNITLQQTTANAGLTLESTNTHLSTGGVVGKYTQSLVPLDTVYTLANI